jgi:hypothetical protein
MIRLTVIVFAAALIACGGIPIRSMPRLLSLQEEIITLNPSDFILAIQVDQRLAPQKNASPTLELTIRPTEPSAFTRIQRPGFTESAYRKEMADLSADFRFADRVKPFAGLFQRA